ncbi:MAG: barstar family protein [Bacteroidota bacterium]
MSSILKLPANYYAADNTRYVFIDGSACANLDTCFTILQEQLSIPDYFGKNLDALEEVLADLEWIEEEKIKIIILHIESLPGNDPVKKKNFLEILDNADNDKIEIIYLGAVGNQQ